MADPSTHINYSFEDIRRYVQGKMPAAEMHAIEKAALQDPFLADAIEGFNEADLTTARQHLNEINAGLFREKKRSKIITFNNKTRWLNIAAMVLIIAGVGVFGVYLLRNSGKQQQVAQVRKEATGNTVLKDSAVTTMNASPEIKKEEPVIAENQTQLKKRTTNKKEDSERVISMNNNKQADEANTATISALPAPAQQDEDASRSFATASPLERKTDSAPAISYNKVAGLNAAANHVFTGKVIDENNTPIPGAFVQSADKKAAVITDLNGDFKLYKTDSVLTVTAGAAGYDSSKASLRARYNDAIVLKEQGKALNEVAVVGYGTRKKSKPADQSATPVGGWENFNQYVIGQLNKDSVVENDMSQEDLVELEFLVDKSGNPYDIKITKSLDDQRNAKAIDILKNGPKWTSTSGKKKAKVGINF